MLILRKQRNMSLTRVSDIEAAANGISGGVRAFVHCAGTGVVTSSAHADVAQQLRLAFELYVVAFVAGVQGLYDRLIGGLGAIIAVSSAAMDVVYPDTLAYGASKAALRRVIDQLAVELGPKGVRVNGVSPGAIDTPMTRRSWSDARFAAERCALIPLGRQAQPRSVTSLIRLLVSAAADYITGETIFVDGGVRHGIFNSAAYAFAESGRKPA
jgi:glucose 1-dehydrogenase